MRGDMTLKAFEQYTRKFGPRMEKALIRGLRQTGTQLVRETKRSIQKKKINDTGALSASVKMYPVDQC